MAKNLVADLKLIERVKRLTIISIFAEDEFLDLLVLKGGNALDLIHGVSTRASIDIDLSMESEFRREDLTRIQIKFAKSLEQTFGNEGFHVFDVTLEEKPPELTEDIGSFWGGYRATFKIIESNLFRTLDGDIDAIRRQSLQVGGKGKLQVDISKHEYTTGKEPADMEGYQIYVYSPSMMIAEKLRAICQQMPEYVASVHKHAAPRARDFIDISETLKKFGIDMTIPDNLDLVKHMFAAKHVPLKLISEIGETEAFHEQGFESVKATVHAGISLRPFSSYFSEVRDLGLRIHFLWNP